jgi:hypothetical protein
MKPKEGVPPQKSEVRINLPFKRKRGGQPGNRNRLKHGAFFRAARFRQARVAEMIRAAQALIVRADLVARARKALLQRGLRKTPPQTANAFDPRGFFARRAPSFSIDCLRIRGPT